MAEKEIKNPTPKPKKAEMGRVGKTTKIMFRKNRKFDLHVGRDMLTFRGRETKSVPESWLKHDDFKQVSKLFVVKGA